MWYKQQVQFAILPRILKAIKISYKAQYSIQFELIHQSEQGKITSAYPYIFKHPPDFNPNKKIPIRQKMGSTNVQNSHGTFETTKFNVNFESHTEYFGDLCLFKLEYKMKRNGRGKTYLLVNVLSHRKVVTEEKPQSHKLELKTVTQKILTRKININLNPLTTQSENSKNFLNGLPFLNNFIQVQLPDTDFFGSIQMYMGLVPLGWKIRDNKLTLCSFLSEDREQKKKVIEGQKKFLNSTQQVGKCIRNIAKQCVETVYEFYEATVKNSIMVTFQLSKHFHKMKQSLESSIQIEHKEEQDSFFTEEEKQYFKTIQELLQRVSEENISDYYGCKNIDDLYFEIHHENVLLCENLRALWQRMLDFLKDLTIDQFQLCCKKETAYIEKAWKSNCVKFINTKVSDTMTSTSRNSVIVNYFHSRSVKNLPRTLGHTEYKITKLSIESTSEIRSSIMDIRSIEVAKFKQWRKGHVQRQILYYEEQNFHPLLMVENYQSVPKNQLKPGHVGLVIFVHGFKGSQYDLERASSYLLKYNEKIEVLRIKTLQNDVDYTIEQMAVAVATEIKRFILCSFLKIDSISIVGYSLGGIISRAALPHLHQFKEKLNVFITFSSPHLGTYATHNTLVKFGIWYLTKFNKCTVLQELHTSRDFKTSTKSYMKLLSEQDCISWFKKIVLVSCQEDQFVPHQSSRVEENIQTQVSENKGGILRSLSPSAKTETQSMRRAKSEMAEMAESIRKYAKKIERVEVWFDNQNKKSTLDKLTGRQSHIEFLDNWCFLKWFFHIYGPQM